VCTLQQLIARRKTPVTPEWRPYSVPTAFKKCRSPECALCIERHAAAFGLSMLKINATAWRLLSLFDHLSFIKLTTLIA